MGRFVLRFLYPHKRRVAVVGALLLIDAVLEMCFALASRWLVDDGLIGKDGVVIAIVLGYLAVSASAKRFSWTAPSSLPSSARLS
jgi:hypothetical protein